LQCSITNQGKKQIALTIKFPKKVFSGK